MKRPYQFAGAALVLFAAFIGYESLSLRLYTRLGPGPGFFPMCLAVMLGGLGAAMFVQGSRIASNALSPGFLPAPAAWRKIGAIAVAVTAVIALVEPLGFCLTMFAFYVFLIRMLDRRGWPETVAVAAAGSFGTYFVFTRWLANPLPAGVLGL